MSHKNGVESEKRMRREIANSNERRRMQSINAGFQLLRSLLPHNEGEKLSKVFPVLLSFFLFLCTGYLSESCLTDTNYSKFIHFKALYCCCIHIFLIKR